MGFSSGKSDSPTSPVVTARLARPIYLTGPEWLSGMYVQGYGKVASYAEGKLFLVEELLLVIKLVLGGPGIVPVTTARAAR